MHHNTQNCDNEWLDNRQDYNGKPVTTNKCENYIHILFDCFIKKS